MKQAQRGPDCPPDCSIGKACRIPRHRHTVHYDNQTDILTFAFTAIPQPAVAEEAADEIWVRYDPETHQVITVDVLNFSARVRAAFGPTLIYTERTDPQRLESLHGLPLSEGDGETQETV